MPDAMFLVKFFNVPCFLFRITAEWQISCIWVLCQCFTLLFMLVMQKNDLEESPVDLEEMYFKYIEIW